MVIRNAYLITEDYYAAEDVCQETFIRLNARLDLVPDENVRAWLLRTSKRLALDYRRNEKRRREHLEYIDADEGQEKWPVSGCFDLSELLAEKEEIRKKRETLLLLKEQRFLWYETLLLSHVEKMRNAEIGQKIGVTASLVSKWKERAGSWLRDRLEKDYLDEDEE
ncbi:MAG: sigma-70 family RNA polymerase sigma factor [Lachnospiraceae bacterium]|nr:sigma-70 family RNA polymerase sigma factor [Lachnospiraceae bacterium]MCD8248927.1 sigma-70 family RNA polymerase sigma factor [Lachnospiraceae bacterium]